MFVSFPSQMARHNSTGSGGACMHCSAVVLLQNTALWPQESTAVAVIVELSIDAVVWTSV